MKFLCPRSVLISCLTIFLWSSSCKKTTVNENGCPPCDTIVNPVYKLSYLTFMLNENNWARQDDGTFSCDLTGLLEESDASVNQVYAISVMFEGNIIQIFPNGKADLFDGSMQGIISGLNNSETCVISFSPSDGTRYYGELRNSGKLPFSSIGIVVNLRK
jgi:hypothetical protein